MLNPFDFAQAKLREASRSSTLRELPATNEILRRSTPQNDIKWGVIIASEAKQSPLKPNAAPSPTSAAQ
jgi:hypothetical protein